MSSAGIKQKILFISAWGNKRLVVLIVIKPSHGFYKRKLHSIRRHFLPYLRQNKSEIPLEPQPHNGLNLTGATLTKKALEVLIETADFRRREKNSGT
jgi:hypothetical protein